LSERSAVYACFALRDVSASGPWIVTERDRRDQSFFYKLSQIDGVFAPDHLAPSDYQARPWRP